MRLRPAILLVLFLSSLVFAQKPAPTPPEQTARQALIEMLTGNAHQIGKHLTLEVQEQLGRSGLAGSAFLSMFELGPKIYGARISDAGPLFMSLPPDSGKSHMEVRVENEQLSGDEYTLSLSLHTIRENGVDDSDWEAYLSHFNVRMKKQAGIWRLDDINLSLDFQVGDPGFLEKTYFKQERRLDAETKAAAAEQAEPSQNPPEMKMPINQFLQWLLSLDVSFAQAHPETGFTCVLADLAEFTQPVGVSGPFFSSGIYNGYKIALVNCLGKPAGSVQIIAEPAPGNAGKAFCTDATHNVRVSEDGRGNTCIASGHVFHITDIQSDDSSGLGVDLHDPSKP
jgi:hypothetical protein